ncbi:MAG: Holliday junction resolvase RuvX [Leptolinea sp.]
MRVFLCLDLGEKRIGVAIGSLDARLAAPLLVFEHLSRKSDIEKVQQMMAAHAATDILIGISRQEDGSPNSMGRHSLSFGGDLEKATGICVVYWDEALSTRDARALRLETGTSRKNRRGHQDSFAAALILQSYFDSFAQNDAPLS